MKTLKQFSLDPILVMVTFSIIPEDIHKSVINENRIEITPAGKHDIVAIIVTNGAWEISSYWKSERDEMINFNEFNFTFGADDLLTVTDDTNSYQGTWSILQANVTTNSTSHLKFNIALACPIRFVKIIDGWQSIEKTTDFFELKDFSSRNGITDFLTFSQN
ncbi:hypothetical protein [Flavobacterium sp. W22_SRS_FP1]|uniref:hypothetical protein n=1 Tax=Flavobacterium sp. W22_SRS_FP1 TaxID=3240276 RepID=UPI003F8DF50C